MLLYVLHIQANGLACQGKYEAGSIPSFAATTSLFVKSHAYWTKTEIERHIRWGETKIVDL